MTQILVHLGAHRTGTTSLQLYLRDNVEILKSHGIQVICPPETRHDPNAALTVTLPQVIISEENLLGSMENSILRGALYPTLPEELEALKRRVPPVDRIFLSVRNLADWWQSAIAFCLIRDQSGELCVDDALLRRISTGARSWVDVVQDIRTAFPDTELVVREFGWKTDNPKRQMKLISGWSAFGETRVKPFQHNKSPAAAKLLEQIYSRQDFDLLARLPATERFDFFTPEERARMSARYLADLEAISGMEDLRYLGDLPERIAQTSPVAVPPERPVPQDRALCVLNIPGVAVASEVDGGNGADKVTDKNPVTLVNSVQSHGTTRLLALFYTDPITRFVQGFENRLRQGRPHDEILWTPAEATAFSFFASANDLAEALESQDARLKSAAHFAFAQISDLRLNMAHFLHSAEALLYEAEKGNIVLCCDIARAAKHAPRIADVLGATAPLPCDPVQSGDRSPQLSQLAQQNLRKFMDHEYGIHAACQEISRQMGFD